MKMRNIPLLAPILFSFASLAHAEKTDLNGEMENAPFISARAAGLGQALSPTATAIDAFYYNPALIGGVHDKMEKPFLTHLYVPYLASEISPGANGLLTERLSGSAMASDEVAEKLGGIWGGENQYARASATPVVVFNRLLAGYTYSTRSAASLDDEDPADPLLHVSERVISGPLLGFSATAPKEEFYLGVSVAFLSVTDSEAHWTAADFRARETRQLGLKDSKERYDGMPIHVGSAYRFKPSYKPTITFVMQDIGSTRYSPADKTKESRVQKENAILGFSLSPKVGTVGALNLVGEFAHLSDAKVKFADKLRLSTEFTFGERFASDASFSVRLGYNSAGGNYGAGMNLGILHAEIASFAEDIGVDRSKMIERRSVVNIGINIADY